MALKRLPTGENCRRICKWLAAIGQTEVPVVLSEQLVPGSLTLAMMVVLRCWVGLAVVCLGCSESPAPETTTYSQTLLGTGQLWHSPQADTSRRILSDTAVQLFAQLPPQAFLPDWLAQQPLPRNERLSLLARQDLPNGYLVLRGTGHWHWDGSTQLAVFPHSAAPGQYTVLVNCTDCNYRALCRNRWSAWQWQGSSFLNVTSQVFATLPVNQLQQLYQQAGGKRATIALSDLFPEVPPNGLCVAFLTEEDGLTATVVRFCWNGRVFQPATDSATLP